MLSELLLRQLNELRLNQVFCDLELVATDKTSVLVHQIVFIAFNKNHFLQALSYAGNTKRTLMFKMFLPSVTGEELNILVEFLYGAKINKRSKYNSLVSTLSKLKMTYLLEEAGEFDLENDFTIKIEKDSDIGNPVIDNNTERQNTSDKETHSVITGCSNVKHEVPLTDNVPGGKQQLSNDERSISIFEEENGTKDTDDSLKNLTPESDIISSDRSILSHQTRVLERTCGHPVTNYTDIKQETCTIENSGTSTNNQFLNEQESIESRILEHGLIVNSIQEPETVQTNCVNSSVIGNDHRPTEGQLPENVHKILEVNSGSETTVFSQVKQEPGTVDVNSASSISTSQDDNHFDRIYLNSEHEVPNDNTEQTFTILNTFQIKQEPEFNNSISNSNGNSADENHELSVVASQIVQEANGDTFQSNENINSKKVIKDNKSMVNQVGVCQNDFEIDREDETMGNSKQNDKIDNEVEYSEMSPLNQDGEPYRYIWTGNCDMDPSLKENTDNKSNSGDSKDSSPGFKQKSIRSPRKKLRPALRKQNFCISNVLVEMAKIAKSSDRFSSSPTTPLNLTTSSGSESLSSLLNSPIQTCALPMVMTTYQKQLVSKENSTIYPCEPKMCSLLPGSSSPASVAAINLMKQSSNLAIPSSHLNPAATPVCKQYSVPQTCSLQFPFRLSSESIESSYTSSNSVSGKQIPCSANMTYTSCSSTMKYSSSSAAMTYSLCSTTALTPAAYASCSLPKQPSLSTTHAKRGTMVSLINSVQVPVCKQVSVLKTWPAPLLLNTPFTNSVSVAQVQCSTTSCSLTTKYTSHSQTISNASHSPVVTYDSHSPTLTYVSHKSTVAHSLCSTTMTNALHSSKVTYKPVQTLANVSCNTAVIPSPCISAVTNDSCSLSVMPVPCSPTIMNTSFISTMTNAPCSLTMVNGSCSSKKKNVSCSPIVMKVSCSQMVIPVNASCNSPKIHASSNTSDVSVNFSPTITSTSHSPTVIIASSNATVTYASGSTKETGALISSEGSSNMSIVKEVTKSLYSSRTQTSSKQSSEIFSLALISTAVESSSHNKTSNTRVIEESSSSDEVEKGVQKRSKEVSKIDIAKRKPLFKKVKRVEAKLKEEIQSAIEISDKDIENSKMNLSDSNSPIFEKDDGTRTTELQETEVLVESAAAFLKISEIPYIKIEDDNSVNAGTEITDSVTEEGEHASENEMLAEKSAPTRAIEMKNDRGSDIAASENEIHSDILNATINYSETHLEAVEQAIDNNNSLNTSFNNSNTPIKSTSKKCIIPTAEILKLTPDDINAVKKKARYNKKPNKTKEVKKKPLKKPDSQETPEIIVRKIIDNTVEIGKIESVQPKTCQVSTEEKAQVQSGISNSVEKETINSTNDDSTPIKSTSSKCIIPTAEILKLTPDDIMAAKRKSNITSTNEIGQQEIDKVCIPVEDTLSKGYESTQSKITTREFESKRRLEMSPCTVFVKQVDSDYLGHKIIFEFKNGNGKNDENNREVSDGIIKSHVEVKDTSNGGELGLSKTQQVCKTSSKPLKDTTPPNEENIMDKGKAQLEGKVVLNAWQTDKNSLNEKELGMLSDANSTVLPIQLEPANTSSELDESTDEADICDIIIDEIVQHGTNFDDQSKESVMTLGTREVSLMKETSIKESIPGNQSNTPASECLPIAEDHIDTETELNESTDDADISGEIIDEMKHEENVAANKESFMALGRGVSTMKEAFIGESIQGQTNNIQCSKNKQFEAVNSGLLSNAIINQVVHSDLNTALPHMLKSNQCQTQVPIASDTTFTNLFSQNEVRNTTILHSTKDNTILPKTPVLMMRFPLALQVLGTSNKLALCPINEPVITRTCITPNKNPSTVKNVSDTGKRKGNGSEEKRKRHKSSLEKTPTVKKKMKCTGSQELLKVNKLDLNKEIKRKKSKTSPVPCSSKKKKMDEISITAVQTDEGDGNMEVVKGNECLLQRLGLSESDTDIDLPLSKLKEKLSNEPSFDQSTVIPDQLVDKENIGKDSSQTDSVFPNVYDNVGTNTVQAESDLEESREHLENLMTSENTNDAQSFRSNIEKLKTHIKLLQNCIEKFESNKSNNSLSEVSDNERDKIIKNIEGNDFNSLRLEENFEKEVIVNTIDRDVTKDTTDDDVISEETENRSIIDNYLENASDTTEMKSEEEPVQNIAQPVEVIDLTTQDNRIELISFGIPGVIQESNSKILTESTTELRKVLNSPVAELDSVKCIKCKKCETSCKTGSARSKAGLCAKCFVKEENQRLRLNKQMEESDMHKTVVKDVYAKINANEKPKRADKRTQGRRRGSLKVKKLAKDTSNTVSEETKIIVKKIKKLPKSKKHAQKMQTSVQKLDENKDKKADDQGCLNENVSESSLSSSVISPRPILPKFDFNVLKCHPEKIVPIPDVYAEENNTFNKLHANEKVKRADKRIQDRRRRSLKVKKLAKDKEPSNTVSEKSKIIAKKIKKLPKSQSKKHAQKMQTSFQKLDEKKDKRAVDQVCLKENVTESPHLSSVISPRPILPKFDLNVLQCHPEKIVPIQNMLQITSHVSPTQYVPGDTVNTVPTLQYVTVTKSSMPSISSSPTPVSATPLMSAIEGGSILRTPLFDVVPASGQPHVLILPANIVPPLRNKVPSTPKLTKSSDLKKIVPKPDFSLQTNTKLAVGCNDPNRPIPVQTMSVPSSLPMPSSCVSVSTVVPSSPALSALLASKPLAPSPKASDLVFKSPH